MDMGRCVQTATPTTPILDVMLRKCQLGNLEEARPADTIDPLAHALPGPRIAFISVEDLLNDLRDFGPARGIIRQTGDNELVERRFRARIGMFASHPDRKLGRVRAVNLHRRARRIAGATANAFLLINLERRLAVDHRRPDSRHRATRNNCRALTDIRDQVVIDPDVHPECHAEKLAAEFPLNSWFEIYDYGVGDEIVSPLVVSVAKIGPVAYKITATDEVTLTLPSDAKTRLVSH